MASTATLTTQQIKWIVNNTDRNICTRTQRLNSTVALYNSLCKKKYVNRFTFFALFFRVFASLLLYVCSCARFLSLSDSLSELCASFVFLLLLLCRLLFRFRWTRDGVCARLAATWLLSVVSVCYLCFKCKRAIGVLLLLLLWSRLLANVYTYHTIEATCMIFFFAVYYFALLLLLLFLSCGMFCPFFFGVSLILFRLSRARTNSLILKQTITHDRY